MKIATWNINSVRLRKNAVARFLRTFEPDVLCLQETKVVDALFPLKPFQRLGYHNVALAGQKAYNGVAILSKLPLDRVAVKNWCGRKDCRHLLVRLADGVELHNVYVPAGGDLPDPERNPKFAHKLAFIGAMTRWFRRRDTSGRAVLVGDLNVAPLEADVWSHEKLKRTVTHTPVEREAMRRLRDANGWVDAVRHFVPESEKLYTWWSYRQSSWRKADKGRRLDHVWVSAALRKRLVSARVVKRVRGWRSPSDHAPVMVELSL